MAPTNARAEGAPVAGAGSVPATGAEPTWIPVPCALCGAAAAELLLVDRVARRDQPGAPPWSFPVNRCARCGFVYVSPRGSGAVFNNLSGGAARRDAAVANRPVYVAGLRRLRALGLPPGAQVLDLGCARGDFLKFASEEGLAVEGVDLHPVLAEAARERGFTVHTGDLRELAEGLGPRFDLVTLWDVIEHVDDPVAVLEACRKVLRPGGLLLFHTGNASFQIPKARWLYRLRPEGGPYLIPYQHLSHFDPASARRSLRQAGLQDLWVGSLGTLHYRQPWKRRVMGLLNLVGSLPPRLGGPLLTNAMGAIGRRGA